MPNKVSVITLIIKKKRIYLGDISLSYSQRDITRITRFEPLPVLKALTLN